MRTLRAWCRFMPRPTCIAELKCEILDDGTILPPLHWELLDQADEYTVRARQLVKSRHRDLPGQQMLPGIVE